jgi:hypothetical protein
VYGGRQNDQEIPMLKGVIGLVTVLFVAGSSLACAQDASPPTLNQTDMNILTDARLGIVKAVLQLTPEQAKYWPAVEDAIHARADARYRRIVAFTGGTQGLSQGREVDPTEVLRARANALAQRAAELNKIVDAWQPLNQSLNPDQKQRMRVLANHVLVQLKDAVDSRRIACYDETDDED